MDVVIVVVVVVVRRSTSSSSSSSSSRNDDDNKWDAGQLHDMQYLKSFLYPTFAQELPRLAFGVPDFPPASFIARKRPSMRMQGSDIANAT